MKNFQFSEYFKFYQYGQWQPAPIVKIDKKSQYVVKEFYLDQFDPNMVCVILRTWSVNYTFYAFFCSLKSIGISVCEPERTQHSRRNVQIHSDADFHFQK